GLGVAGLGGFLLSLRLPLPLGPPRTSWPTPTWSSARFRSKPKTSPSLARGVGDLGAGAGDRGAAGGLAASPSVSSGSLPAPRCPYTFIDCKAAALECKGLCHLGTWQNWAERCRFRRGRRKGGG